MAMIEQENLLQDLHNETHLAPVSAGKRFGTFLIDLVVFYILIFVITIVLVSEDSIITSEINGNGFSVDFKFRLTGLLFYALLMGLQETIFKGRSIGKFVMGTRAVNLDGSLISPKTAFLRGFSRAVPFCAFSALGTPCNPWQDKWTDTIVVDEKDRVHH